MKKLNHLYLLTLIITIGIGLYFIFKPFLVAIFLAFILSRLFNEWYQKILKIFKNPSLSAFLTSSIIFLIIFLPLVFVGKLVATELVNSYQIITSENFKTEFFAWRDSSLQTISEYPSLTNKLNGADLLNNQNINHLLKNTGNLLASLAKYLYQGTSHFLFTLFIMFFCLYYFFKDGDRLINKIIQLSPLKNSQEKKLLENFIGISRATLKGSLIVAIVQGGLTTVLLIATGIPSAVLLGVVATIFALIPMLGTAVVWLPIGLITLALGNIWQGITILLVGSLIIGSVDNILRPYLVGKNTSLHPLLVFLSTVGGISFFGIAGFLLGPVTVVLFLNLLEIYKTEFATELKKFNS